VGVLPDRDQGWLDLEGRQDVAIRRDSREGEDRPVSTGLEGGEKRELKAARSQS